MKKNVSGQSTGAQLVNSSDGTAFTGTATVVITEDNGTQTASGGTAPAHEGNGYHSYSPTQGETDADHIAFTWTGTGAIPVTIQVYTTFPQTVDNDVLNQSNETLLLDIPTVSEFNARTILSADYFDPAADAVANVTLVATTTALTNDAGITQAGADKVWDTTARILTASTNFNDISTADVNTQVVDVLFTDTITLIGQAAPSNTPTIAGAMGYVYKMGRNRTLQTATLWSLFADNGTTVDHTAVVSDDGTTSETAEVIAGT